MINHKINKCSKLAQRDYTTTHNWVGKVIYWELCKKLKFVYTNICAYAQSTIRP